VRRFVSTALACVTARACTSFHGNDAANGITYAPTATKLDIDNLAGYWR